MDECSSKCNCRSSQFTRSQYVSTHIFSLAPLAKKTGIRGSIDSPRTQKDKTDYLTPIRKLNERNSFCADCNAKGFVRSFYSNLKILIGLLLILEFLYALNVVEYIGAWEYIFPKLDHLHLINLNPIT